MGDAQRPLDARGEHEAAWLGKRLHQRGVIPDFMLSSSATRALRTANIIAEFLGLPESVLKVQDDMYLANGGELLNIIRELEDELNYVMLFGHNPGITRVAQNFLGEWIESMPTCGIYCLEFKVRSWKVVTGGNARLIFYDYPLL